MRSLFLYNVILPLSLPFCDQKGSEKVPATSDSALLRIYQMLVWRLPAADSSAMGQNLCYVCFCWHILCPSGTVSTLFVGGGVPDAPDGPI